MFLIILIHASPASATLFCVVTNGTRRKYDDHKFIWLFRHRKHKFQLDCLQPIKRFSLNAEKLCTKLFLKDP